MSSYVHNLMLSRPKLHTDKLIESKSLYLPKYSGEARQADVRMLQVALRCTDATSSCTQNTLSMGQRSDSVRKVSQAG